LYIITIDSGTTNSRIRLIENKQNTVIDVIKKPVGVRNTAIDGNIDALKNGIAEGLQEIINRNKLQVNDIQYIVATGMITSNLGLHEVKHIEGPCGLEKFAKASSVQIVESYFNIPCIFVPGMKNRVEDYPGKLLENIDSYDVMRGEEVETFGLLHQLGLKGKGMILLPGSHTKFVFVNNGQIESCYSTLCGEILFAVSRNTILSSSLNKELITGIEREYLIEGYKSSKKVGLTRSLYHVRLLHLFDQQMNDNQRSNYFAGAVIASDIHSIQKSNRFEDLNWVVIGGAYPLRKAFVEIFSHMELSDIVVEATDEQVELSTVIGSKAIGDIVSLNLV
jgi:2-dehydro-3-deoxygalactonokinase